MKSKKNYTQGVNGKYNFYVIAFDTQNNFVNYGIEKSDLTLFDAKKTYKEAVLSNPRHVNTMLGVFYVTDKSELEPYDSGALDILQCIDGKINLCDDYKNSAVLNTEGFIAVNVVNILKRYTDELQKQINKNVEKDNSSNNNLNSNSLIEKLYNNQAKLQKKERNTDKELAI